MRDRIENCISESVEALLRRQKPDGSFVGEVELNPGPTAQVIILHWALRLPFEPRWVEKAVRYLRRTQNEDGGWSPHRGAASDVSVTLECVVALRVIQERLPEAGVEPEQVSRAVSCIHRLGGVARANDWTRLYLGVVGVVPWEDVRKVPLDMVLIPSFSPWQLHHFSYWVTTISVPMAVVGALGPVRPTPLSSALRKELGIQASSKKTEKRSFTERAQGLLPTRLSSKVKKHALARAFRVIEGFTERSGDFGGNSCTAINVLLAYYFVGKGKSEAFSKGFDALMSYAIETESEWRMQTCQSHVWDTGFSLLALPPGHPAAEAGCRWLLDRQILDVKGAWARNAEAEPGGWCFGNRHDHYPVTDCTAMSLVALLRHHPELVSDPRALRAVRWLLALQHSSGGWSAYTKYEKGKELEAWLQFKDIPNAMVDLPKADVSAKVVEALSHFRHLPEVNSALERAHGFLLAAREEFGLWKGNYGVNFIYGTSFAAQALAAIEGEEGATNSWRQPVLDFFLKSQNSDGGWGESHDTYSDSNLRGKGESTVVQTAWAILGLSSVVGESGAARDAIERGVRFLIERELPSGGWEEQEFLGTVFPGMVYFRYELYPAYFPLMALEASARALISGVAPERKHC